MTYPDTGGGGKIEPDECMHWKFPGAVCKHDKKGADACECGPECRTVEGCVDVDHGCNPSSECDAGTCDCADCQCEGPCDCGTVKEEIIPQSAFSFRGPETIDMTSMSDKATRLIQVGGEQSVLEERLMNRIIERPDTGCWICVGSASRGYPTMRVGDQVKYCHRLAYELWVGPLPEDWATWTVDHRCEIPRCVNPSHLTLMTRGENAKLGGGSHEYARRKRAETHCKKGHEYTEESTGWVRSQGAPYRRCLICNREAWAKWTAKSK